jgi:signal transduction histidine kinase
MGDIVMAYARAEQSNAHESWWQVLERLRWPLGGVVALTFAIGQLIESLLLGDSQQRLAWDVLAWAVLGGAAMWLSLTWISRREGVHQADMRAALLEQQRLNAQLQRANKQLEVLHALNKHIATSTTLDEILDAALQFPGRIVQSEAAALLLLDLAGPVLTRSEGASTEEMAEARLVFGIGPTVGTERRVRQLFAAPGDPGRFRSCLLLPLHDGLAPRGWIELYSTQATPVADDEMALLETVTTELSEAKASARRRSREERAIYELEKAIAEERARIAHDIHDGIAQSLAFVRMRIDLWEEWITANPDKVRQELSRLKITLLELLRDLRRAIFALRPVQFDEMGFSGGLHRYISEFAEQQEWVAYVDIAGLPASLRPELEAVCFRVVQEALTNAAKHSSAHSIRVQLGEDEGGLLVVVKDDGRGFMPRRNQFPEDDQEHLGLRQMRERLQSLGGRLTLLSHPGAGTELRAWLPLRRVLPVSPAVTASQI